VLAGDMPGAVAIATLAWDRLIVNPLPGPRSAADLTGLDGRRGYDLVTAASRPVPPAGSTLPRLASELPLPLILARSNRRRGRHPSAARGGGWRPWCHSRPVG
jgi:hypothetical protein